MYQRLVVPLDGSDIAESALVEAEQMAALTQALIHLIRVVDVTDRDTASIYGVMADPSDVSVLLTDEVDAARQYLESIAQRITEHGYHVTWEVWRGPAANQLIAASKPGDLYVMASHGRSGIARWFMGSVAEDVVRRSSVPVLLIRASLHTARMTDQAISGTLSENIAGAR